jgi:predicted N-acetyltransferase YhbS
MEVNFRTATEQDFHKSEDLTRESFWDLYRPGCVEHLILHKIRESACYIEELDLVALFGGEIIGHIICSKAKVIDSRNPEHVVLCVGPFAVLPAYQKKGYGSMLMEFCITRAKDLGYSGMILFGNPDYYHRFGFRNAAEYGITTKDGINMEPFMAKELREGGWKGISGKFFEDGSFTINDSELNAFEKRFLYREKHVTPTQFKE